MHSVKQGIAWAKSAEAEYRNGKSWSGWCQSFAYRFSGATHSAATAYLGYKASGKIQSTDFAKAPAGAFHWWSDGGPGHVAVSLGNGVAAMASGSVTTSWGVAQGKVSMAHYNATHKNLKYLGWTYDFCGQYMTDIADMLAAAKRKKVAAAAKIKAEKIAAEKKAAKDKADAAARDAVALAKSITAMGKVYPNLFVEAPLAKEQNSPEVYLLNALGTKTHVSHPQWVAWKARGAKITTVADGSLGVFRTV